MATNMKYQSNAILNYIYTHVAVYEHR